MTHMTTATLPDSLIKSIAENRRTVSQAEIKQYKADGYLLLKGVVNPDEAQALYEDVMGIMEIIGLGHTKLRQTAQYLLGSALEAYVKSGPLKGIATALMESPAHLYLPFTAVKSGGGGGRFHYHQDGNYTRYVQGQGINLWTALVPMREENGGLKIVPGSHISGEKPSENAGDGDNHRKVAGGEPEGARLIEMEPGDVVAFTRWTVHGSGPNETNQHRAAYAMQFHSDDAVAVFDGGEHLLRENPRFKDIWGVTEIIPDNAGKRDGH